MALHLQLKHGVDQRIDGDDLLLLDQRGRVLRLSAPSGPIEQVIQRLADGGGTLPVLMAGCSSLAPFAILQQLEKKAWISLSLAGGEGPLLTLEPQATVLERRYPPEDPVQVRWSHFVQITPHANGVLLEAPLQGSKVILQHKSLLSLIWNLNSATSWQAVVEVLPQDIQDQSKDLLMLLLTAGVVGVVESDGTISCDRQANVERWSREDLWLHHRSRSGWHQHSLGATFPGAEREPAPALLHQGAFIKAVPLPQLPIVEPEPGFFSILERRRSRRHPSPHAITLEQLSHLLWSSLRITALRHATPGVPKSYEAASRPVACGGAMQEIDTYLIVHRCDGIAAGLYRYDPLDHQLLQLDDLNRECKQLLHNACRSSGTDQEPDVLLQFAARLGRVSWKYDGIPYALILKHVGVIMQQLYLVATALDLAPCSLGCGDSELFSRATKLDPWSDTPVGEFMLSAATQEA